MSMYSPSDVRRRTRFAGAPARRASDVIICGVDEAGRGALAGPLVAAAVICTLPLSYIAALAKSPIRDSKTLSQIQRERIYQIVVSCQLQFLTETISVEDINNKGIGWANKEAMRRLIEGISADHYILDGKLTIKNIKKENITVESIVDADATHPPVILAGIIAKVTRDKIMIHLDQEFPQYGWKTNKGYGTKFHIETLQKYEPCQHHRTIFVQTALSHSANT